MSEVLDLTIELCRRASVTPADGGCQALVAKRLARAGFRIEALRYGEVENLWATHGGEGPVLAFLGHTDVVPTGPESAWSTPPFAPQVRDGRLFARGAADMKGSVAAMVLALERFAREQPAHRGRVALLLTSDEEGVAIDGVRRVVETFRARGERIDFCLVGEPSSKTHLGDVVRVGRRGSLNGTLRVRGVQGHVAFPELALNPIHALAPALAELVAIEWDRGNERFPPTRLQVSNIASGTGATNVIPGTLDMLFNFRFGTASRAEDLMQRTEAVLVKHGLDYRIEWSLSGAPYLTEPGALIDAVRHAVRKHTGIDTRADTGGGTSDGRFVATLGAQVVELGPVNATIHMVDENVLVSDLEKLPDIYFDVAKRLLVV